MSLISQHYNIPYYNAFACAAGERNVAVRFMRGQRYAGARAKGRRYYRETEQGWRELESEREGARERENERGRRDRQLDQIYRRQPNRKGRSILKTDLYSPPPPLRFTLTISPSSPVIRPFARRAYLRLRFHGLSFFRHASGWIFSSSTRTHTRTHESTRDSPHKHATR